MGREVIEFLMKKCCDGKSTRNGLELKGHGSYDQGNKRVKSGDNRGQGLETKPGGPSRSRSAHDQCLYITSEEL